MLQIQQLKLPIDHSPEDLLKKAAKKLSLQPKDLQQFTVVKKSLDARKKPELCYSYTVAFQVPDESALLRRKKDGSISAVQPVQYRFPSPGPVPMGSRPVIIGTGPAGLFCGLMLAAHGYAPILLERGKRVEERVLDVERFWKGGPLDESSNVQFGEGGAGTFSDGKLNTLVKDKYGRNRKVLELFVECGADPEILYLNRPHIGTDVLRTVLINIRRRIEAAGGEFRFQSEVTDLVTERGRLTGVEINREEILETGIAVLAIGHSARNTFAMLQDCGVLMEQKSFAVGLRIEHPQSMINLSQYGVEASAHLPAADYKLTHQCVNHRGIYTFCMCPGGYVVNASSERGMLAVNGMSNHKRDGRNANSALIVTVTPDDFGEKGALAGVEFQRRLESAAYRLGDGKIPTQLLGDFAASKASTTLGGIRPDSRGETCLTNLRELLPEPISAAILEGTEAFEKRIHGFTRPDAVLSGVESRTSSPVRILRNEQLESGIAGLYPCGEGAGYAGGIMSAAMDGMKVAEEIAKKFKML